MLELLLGDAPYTALFSFNFLRFSDFSKVVQSPAQVSPSFTLPNSPLIVGKGMNILQYPTKVISSAKQQLVNNPSEIGYLHCFFLILSVLQISGDFFSHLYSVYDSLHIIKYISSPKSFSLINTLSFNFSFSFLYFFLA